MAEKRIWLIATVAALFGLLAPPCALACLEILSGELNGAQFTNPSCHEQDSNSMPSQAPGSREDCGSDFSYEAYIPGSAASSGAGTLAVILSSTPLQTLETGRHWALATSRASKLPSPDVLLLKSTLLI